MKYSFGRYIVDSKGGIKMDKFYLYCKNNCVYVIQNNKVIISFKNKGLGYVKEWFDANIKGVQLICVNS